MSRVVRDEPLRGGDPRVAQIPGMQHRGGGRYVHERANVSNVLNIGPGTLVWAYSDVMEGAFVGKNCMLGQGVHVSTGAVVGDGCSLQNGAQIFKGVTLGSEVFIGPHVAFTNVKVPRAWTCAVEFLSTRVERGASIGANATIVCGVTIGAYAMIGAGTVVTKNVPCHAVVVGNPGRIMGYVCECGVALPKVYHAAFPCSGCKKSYIFRRGDGALLVAPLGETDAKVP